MGVNNIERLPELIKEMYTIIHKLEEHFPGRHFTPDGHLVGSIGEVLASHYYGLTLLPASTEKHDAICSEGRMVQIKATQGKSIGLSSQPDYLLVLKILPNGLAEEIFNGPGKLAWDNAGKMQKTGHRPISAFKLRALMESVEKAQRISQANVM